LSSLSFSFAFFLYARFRRAILGTMNKVSKYISLSALVFILLACSAFPSGRLEQPSGKQETRAFWVLDGSMSAESAQMFLERYLFPTSLATMLWTDFTLQGGEVRLDTLGGYRIVRKQQVLAEPIGGYTIYGYDLIIDVTRPAEGRPSAGRAATVPSNRTVETYVVRFSYPEAADTGSGSSGLQKRSVLPQPLEQALLAGIRKDGRDSGKGRVEKIEYLGSGRFEATVLIGD
jgi:hypothetical protein